MITKELAMSLRVGQELRHNFVVNKDGTSLRARVIGKCRTWKTRPEDFVVPMKHGLKECFYLTSFAPTVASSSAANWSLPERWPIERFWKDGQS